MRFPLAAPVCKRRARTATRGALSNRKGEAGGVYGCDGSLVVLAALGVAVALFNGILSMAYGGEADQRESHRHMFKRVGWQALAILLVLIALVASRLVEHGAISPPG